MSQIQPWQQLHKNLYSYQVDNITESSTELTSNYTEDISDFGNVYEIVTNEEKIDFKRISSHYSTTEQIMNEIQCDIKQKYGQQMFKVPTLAKFDPFRKGEAVIAHSTPYLNFQKNITRNLNEVADEIFEFPEHIEELSSSNVMGISYLTLRKQTLEDDITRLNLSVPAPLNTKKQEIINKYSLHHNHPFLQRISILNKNPASLLYEIFAGYFKIKPLIEINEVLPKNPQKPEFHAEFILNGEKLCFTRTISKKEAKSSVSLMAIKLLYPSFFEKYIRINDGFDETIKAFEVINNMNSFNDHIQNVDIDNSNVKSVLSKIWEKSDQKNVYETIIEEKPKEVIHSKPKFEMKKPLSLISTPFDEFSIHQNLKTDKFQTPIENIMKKPFETIIIDDSPTFIKTKEKHAAKKIQHIEEEELQKEEQQQQLQQEELHKEEEEEQQQQLQHEELQQQQQQRHQQDIKNIENSIEQFNFTDDPENNFKAFLNNEVIYDYSNNKKRFSDLISGDDLFQNHDDLAFYRMLEKEFSDRYGKNDDDLIPQDIIYEQPLLLNSDLNFKSDIPMSLTALNVESVKSNIEPEQKQFKNSSPVKSFEFKSEMREPIIDLEDYGRIQSTEASSTNASNLGIYECARINFIKMEISLIENIFAGKTYNCDYKSGPINFNFIIKNQVCQKLFDIYCLITKVMPKDFQLHLYKSKKNDENFHCLIIDKKRKIEIRYSDANPSKAQSIALLWLLIQFFSAKTLNEILEKLKQLLEKLVAPAPVKIQKNQSMLYKDALSKKDPNLQARNDSLARDFLNLEKFIDEYDFQDTSLDLLEHNND